MNTLILFASTYILVFALGMETLMVSRGHFLGAFFNSLLISVAQLLVLKIGPAAAGIEVLGYVLGGPFGIISAMYTYRRWVPKTQG